MRACGALASAPRIAKFAAICACAARVRKRCCHARKTLWQLLRTRLDRAERYQYSPCPRVTHATHTRARMFASERVSRCRGFARESQDSANHKAEAQARTPGNRFDQHGRRRFARFLTTRCALAPANNCLPPIAPGNRRWSPLPPWDAVIPGAFFARIQNHARSDSSVCDR